MRSSFEGIFLESCNDGCRVKIQHKSIQVVAEGIGLENYLVRNVAALSQQLQRRIEKSR